MVVLLYGDADLSYFVDDFGGWPFGLADNMQLYSTLAVITQTTMFAAAIDRSGPVNLLSMYG
jgi:hypothetical protein